MPAWALLQHVPFEGPGLIAVQARAHGLQLDHRHLYRDDAVPSLEEVTGLVVLGGPMAVGDAEAHPHLAAEIDLLAAAVAANVPVLGICLGAQLLARALGAEVLPGATSEMGLGSVTLTDAGSRDVVLGPAGPVLPVLHWHNDTFTLPAGAELLASSDQCVNQAFRVGRAYGLQFHVELDLALAKRCSHTCPQTSCCTLTTWRASKARGGRCLGASLMPRDPQPRFYGPDALLLLVPRQSALTMALRSAGDVPISQTDRGRRRRNLATNAAARYALAIAACASASFARIVSVPSLKSSSGRISHVTRPNSG